MFTVSLKLDVDMAPCLIRFRVTADNNFDARSKERSGGKICYCLELCEAAFSASRFIKTLYSNKIEQLWLRKNIGKQALEFYGYQLFEVWEVIDTDFHRSTQMERGGRIWGWSAREGQEKVNYVHPEFSGHPAREGEGPLKANWDPYRALQRGIRRR